MYRIFKTNEIDLKFIERLLFKFRHSVIIKLIRSEYFFISSSKKISFLLNEYNKIENALQQSLNIDEFSCPMRNIFCINSNKLISFLDNKKKKFNQYFFFISILCWSYQIFYEPDNIFREIEINFNFI